MSSKEFGINIHEEWKGMTQPVGLVVEPIVLDRFGIFPERSIKVISDLQSKYNYTPQQANDFIDKIKEYFSFDVGRDYENTVILATRKDESN